MGNYAFIALGVYAVLSLTLFIFPTIIRKKKKLAHVLYDEALNSPSKKVAMIAHRGGAREEVENTIEAFKKAEANQTHMIECDLQITKDGVVVIAHDNELERLCGVHSQISHLNYNELPPFKKEIELHFSNHASFQNTHADIKFAKLEDAFEKLPNMMFHIDLKICGDELMRKTNELVIKYKKENHVVWGSMRSNRTLKELNPRVPTFFAAGGFMKVFFFFLIGLLPFVSLEDDVFSGPKYTVEFERIRKDKTRPKPWFMNIALCFFSIFELFSGLIFRHLQKRGIPVFVWVLNDPKDFKEAIDKGVNGIMTDVPSLLHQYLQEENKYLNLQY